MKYTKGRQQKMLSPLGLRLLCVNDLAVHDLHGTRMDVVHPPDPLHRVSCFELFRNTLCLLHLFDERVEQFLRLLVDVGRIAVF
jgi:hypothetical protein